VGLLQAVRPADAPALLRLSRSAAAPSGADGAGQTIRALSMPAAACQRSSPAGSAGPLAGPVTFRFRRRGACGATAPSPRWRVRPLVGRALLRFLVFLSQVRPFAPPAIPLTPPSSSLSLHLPQPACPVHWCRHHPASRRCLTSRDGSAVQALTAGAARRRNRGSLHLPGPWQSIGPAAARGPLARRPVFESTLEDSFDSGKIVYSNFTFPL
jgi:hypothetical protein